MTTNEKRSWGTAAELAYLDGLAAKPDRVIQLRRYLALADKRQDWGPIDKREATTYARALIQAPAREASQ